MISKKKLSIILAVAILTLTFAYAIRMNTFNNSLTAENLTFGGNENITRNISIYRYGNFTSATINLSAFLYECYQESANVSNQSGTDGNCGLSYTGLYSVVNVTNVPYFYINYTKPTNSISSVWRLKIGTIGEQNISVPPSCFSQLLSQFRISSGSGSSPAKGYCFNGTEWLHIGQNNTDQGGTNTNGEATTIEMQDGNWFTCSSNNHPTYGWSTNCQHPLNDELAVYEDGVYWTLNYSYNASVIINNTHIWNFTGQFNQTNNKTNNFASTLNQMLSGGTCNGGVLNGNNCTINLTFHSDTAGTLQYSDIRIDWVEYSKPNLTIAHPNQTYSGITYIPLNFTALDDYALDTCYYNVTIGASLDVANTVTSCSQNTTFTVNFGDGNYVLRMCINDTSNNANCTTSSFTTTAYVPPPASPGGGSGGGTTSQNATWLMRSSSGTNNIDIITSRGSIRSDYVEFTNLKSEAVNITLSLDTDLGKLVYFESTSAFIPGSTSATSRADYYIDAGELPDGIYYGNIIARDQNNQKREIGVKITVGPAGIFTKLFASTKIGSIVVPYFLISLVFSILIGGGVTIAMYKNKKYRNMLAFVSAFLAFFLPVLIL